MAKKWKNVFLFIKFVCFYKGPGTHEKRVNGTPVQVTNLAIDTQDIFNDVDTLKWFTTFGL